MTQNDTLTIEKPRERRFRTQHMHIFDNMAEMLEREATRLPEVADVPSAYRPAYQRLRASIGMALRSIETLQSPDVTPARVVHDFTDRPQEPRPVVDGYWVDGPADEADGHYLTAWDVITNPWLYGPVLSAASVGGALYWLFGG